MNGFLLTFLQPRVSKQRKTATAVEGPSSPGRQDCWPRDRPAGGSGLSCPVLSERACDMTVTSLPTRL